MVNRQAPHIARPLVHGGGVQVGDVAGKELASVTVEGEQPLLHHIAGLRQKLLMMQANGGVATAARTVPIFTIESGPAAGVVGAAQIAMSLDLPNVIATDVGGTTFKVAIVDRGRWGYSRETVLNQYQLRLPMVDVASIGAGGGSIAWVDRRRLRIGPQSAAASPGPAIRGTGRGWSRRSAPHRQPTRRRSRGPARRGRSSAA